MIRYPVAAVVLAIAWLAWRRRGHGEARDVKRWLIQLALGVLALRAFSVAAEMPALAPASPAFWALAAAAALALWWPLAHLSAQQFGASRWGRFVRLPLAVLGSVLLLIPGVSWAAPTTFAAMVAPGFAWRRKLSTRALFWTALGAIGVFLVLLRPPGLTLSNDPPTTGVVGALRDVVRWARAVMIVWSILAIFRTFAAFVSDPSLGIRTVSRRLVLSHVLVVLVPLMITFALWLTTTWLGVGSDRALVAGRTFELTTTELQRALAEAVRPPADATAAVRAIAAARAADWPQARAWRVDEGRLTRVLGDSIPGDSTMLAWAAAPDSVRDHGVVVIDTTLWAGALARDRSRTHAVVLLSPLAEMVAAAPSRVSGADIEPALVLRRRVGRFSVNPNALPDSSADADDLEEALRESLLVHGVSLSGSDSLKLAQLRKYSRAMGLADSVVQLGTGGRARGAVVIDTDQGSFEAGPQTTVDNDMSNWMGQSIVRSVTFVSGRAVNIDFTLAAKVSLRRTLAGLWSTTSENPLSVIPMVVLIALMSLLLPVAVFNFAMVGGMGRSITQATGALRRAATAIGGGDLAHRIDVKGDDDLWDTARQFNRMAEGLERARELEAERSRLESELELARRIQARLLPAHAPDVPGLEIAGRSESAREVGGDYYDHIPLGDARVLLVIADVSGKGVGAALLMSAFRASLMSQDSTGTEPARLAGRLNDFLHRSVEPGKFVTAFVGFLDGASGRFVYANAGHNPPVVLRAGGEVEMLSAGGLILGILPGAPFESGSVELAPGDLLVLYTDGVTEGADATNEQWGEERLIETLRRRQTESCEAVANGIVREVRAFEGETGPADDITVLVARRRPPEAWPRHPAGATGRPIDRAL